MDDESQSCMKNRLLRCLVMMLSTYDGYVFYWYNAVHENLYAHRIRWYDMWFLHNYYDIGILLSLLILITILIWHVYNRKRIMGCVTVVGTIKRSSAENPLWIPIILNFVISTRPICLLLNFNALLCNIQIYKTKTYIPW